MSHPREAIWSEAIKRAVENRIAEAKKLGLAETSDYVTQYIADLESRAEQRAGYRIPY